MAALRASGWTPDALEEKIWIPHHTWAGDELYRLSIDLRGFYLKVGQFLGARVDFIPEPICRRLSLLQDKVCTCLCCRTRCAHASVAGSGVQVRESWLQGVVRTCICCRTRCARARRSVAGTGCARAFVAGTGCAHVQESLLQDWVCTCICCRDGLHVHSLQGRGVHVHL